MEHLAIDNVDSDMIAARTKFIALAKQNGGLARFAENDKEHSEELEAIRLILNDFELISTAIQFGVVDFDFYRKYNQGTVIRYWECAAPFIHALRQRTGRETLFCEFEALAMWIKDKKGPPSRRWLFWRKSFF